VSDVDNTLLGDDAALEQFANWYAAAKQNVRLAYNSGRFPRSLARSVETSGLPRPDAYIGGVGTEIEITATGKTLGDWPPTDARWDPTLVRSVLLSHKELRPQPEHLLSKYKVSVYGDDLDDAFVDRLRRQFEELELNVNVVYSSGRDLDVLPAGTNKGTAIAHLADHWQIPTEHVIVAGDSGNDLDMFRQGFNGIVVGNALPELKTFTAAHVYHAREHYAAGVLEGLKHWLAKSGVS
jgi:sucrose-6F-phosphate phosphohydrolase